VECYSITHGVLPDADNLAARETVAEVTTTNKTKTGTQVPERKNETK
jgi:hypothetical protein